MIVSLEMHQWAKAMMVCATAHQCPKEETCFNLAQSVIDAYAAQALSTVLKRADEVDHYDPEFRSSWELAQPDWDSA